MSNKVVRQITAMISGSKCNFNCDYCYRKDQGVHEKNIPTRFEYDIPHMLNALSTERIGGRASIVVVGGGETLYNKNVISFVKGLLAQGHVVEVVTNLTLSNRIDELLDCSKDDLSRLIVKGSFHFFELKKNNFLDIYFENIRNIIKSGASAFPFLVIYKGYLPILEELYDLFMHKIGFLPHLTSALDFTNQEMRPEKFYDENLKNYLFEKYNSNIHKVFDKFLHINPKEHFCYAGDWSLLLDTSQGNTMKCFYAPVEQNIFQDLSKKIQFEPIGKNCCIANCALHYNLTTFGCLPEFKDIPLYGDVLYKNESFNPKIKEYLNTRFDDYYKPLTKEREEKISEYVKLKFTLEENKCKMPPEKYDNVKKLLEKGVNFYNKHITI